MLVIAERINATRKPIARAMEDRDADFIANEVRVQDNCGADFIDVNAGDKPEKEIESLLWAVEVVQANTDLPLCLDCASVRGFEVALEAVKSENIMLNSVNGEREKMAEVFPVAADAGAKLIGLLMDENGLPTGVEDRLEIAGKIIEEAEKHGIGVENLYLDPCAQPLSTSPQQGEAVIQAVKEIMGRFPGVHTTVGLSNISFGLPYRSVLNRTYVAFLIRAGMDSAILDPTEQDMMATIYATEALVGKDEFCLEYIQAARNGRLRPLQADE
jgi:5-methyltetrahydrofolate--homocysteine methyltransferase